MCTSETKFRLSSDSFNAYGSYRENTIEIGKEFFTLETFVHEINEIEITRLEKELFGILSDNILFVKNSDDTIKLLNHNDVAKILFSNDSKITLRKSWISHLISPYGEDSLMYPSIVFNRVPVNEELLVNDDYSDVINELMPELPVKHVRQTLLTEFLSFQNSESQIVTQNEKKARLNMRKTKKRLNSADFLRIAEILRADRIHPFLLANLANGMRMKSMEHKAPIKEAKNTRESKYLSY